MPALITHHIFGEDAAALLPDSIIGNEEELMAFLLGNQGPDPMFTRFSLLTVGTGLHVHQLANDMHAKHVTRAFLAMRTAVERLPECDCRIGRAFALGFVGHYALDRTAHPFIYAEQYDLIAADPSLKEAEYELHSVIETDIDSWILWEKRHATVAERPAASNLQRTKRIDRVAGLIISQTARDVFGIPIDPEQYGHAVADYEWIYHAIEPAGCNRLYAIAFIERIFRKYSFAEAAAHYITTSDECPAANLDRHPWKDPATGVIYTDSFADRYEQASLYYPKIAEAFVRGDAVSLYELVDGVNYNGQLFKDD